MEIAIRKGRPPRFYIRVLPGVLVYLTVILSILKFSAGDASAHSGHIFGPACGAALLDGNVGDSEWSNASKLTFPMFNPGVGAAFNATLYVMNSGQYLYLGITIDDDEFSTQGNFLPQGDGFRIDFDNDRSGSLFALHDDVLGINAGFPQFADNYIDGDPVSSSSEADVNGGGASNGSGAAGRIGNQNHFELRHPLCSGDTLDFCLHPGDVIGFRLEYLDAQADGSLGGVQLFPGGNDTSEADIIIGTCSLPDFSIYLPLLRK